MARKKSKRRPGVQLSASQKAAYEKYKREAAALGHPVGGKKKRKYPWPGAQVNVEMPLPESKTRYIRASEHPKRGDELRCMICGAWYGDHTAGEFAGARWEDGVAAVRHAAQADGDDGGGYRSKGPVLWAMRTLKTHDFNMVHEAYHGGGQGIDWRRLGPWENVGVPGREDQSNNASYEQPDDPIWMVDADAGVVYWDLHSLVWWDQDKQGWDCGTELRAKRGTKKASELEKLAWDEDYDAAPEYGADGVEWIVVRPSEQGKCSHTTITAKAVADGEQEEIPF